MKFYKKCLGCGNLLQDLDSNKTGYVLNLQHEFCLRCFKLKNYNEISKNDLNFIKEDSKNILDLIIKDFQNEKIENKKIIYIFDAFYFPFNDLPIIDKNDDVIIIINKIDLIPKSIKKEKLIKFYKNYLKEFLKIKQLFLISSKKLWGIDSLIKYLKMSKINVFFLIGHVNSGKTSLINAILKSMNLKHELLISQLPGTTLKQNQIKLNNINLVDLPGYFNLNDFWLKLDFKAIQFLLLEKEVKVKTFQLKQNQAIFIDCLIKIETLNHNDQIISYHLAISDKLKINRLNNNKQINDLNHILCNLPKLNLPIFEDQIKLENDNKRYEFYYPGLGYIMTYGKGQTIKISSVINNKILLNQNLFSTIKDNDRISR